MDTPLITDEELDEFEGLVNFDHIYEAYEYSGNFVITKDIAERDEAVCNMCCGIKTEDIKMSNGEVIYFAFDYGH